MAVVFRVLRNSPVTKEEALPAVCRQVVCSAAAAGRGGGVRGGGTGHVHEVGMRVSGIHIRRCCFWLAAAGKTHWEIQGQQLATQ